MVSKVSSEIEKRCPEYLPFCNSIGLVKDPYNNKDYSGRYCDKLLRNLDKLEEIVSKEQISAFEKCSFDIYMDFDINFSTKAHIPIEHVPQVIQRTGKGLFFQSEEVVEATHSLTSSGKDSK